MKIPAIAISRWAADSNGDISADGYVTLSAGGGVVGNFGVSGTFVAGKIQE